MTDQERLREFVKLFTQYEVRLRAFAMTLLANHSDVEDVLQQTNLILWEKFEDYELGTNFMAWAGRVLYIKAQHHRRAQMQDKLRFGDSFGDAILREASREEVANELGDRERALAECIGELRPNHRKLLQARYDEKRTTEQMVKEFKRSPDAIYNTLSRIRRALFDCVTGKLGREVSGGT